MGNPGNRPSPPCRPPWTPIRSPVRQRPKDNSLASQAQQPPRTLRVHHPPHPPTTTGRTGLRILSLRQACRPGPNRGTSWAGPGLARKKLALLASASEPLCSSLRPCECCYVYYAFRSRAMLLGPWSVRHKMAIRHSAYWGDGVPLPLFMVLFPGSLTRSYGLGMSCGVRKLPPVTLIRRTQAA